MRLYHHPRIETYENDQRQAWIALVGSGIAAVIACALIIAAVLSGAAA
ncbi:MAG TPA: hypothetical protein VGF94_21000 [Kofleriaceae bacterium]|jgi:hypothetical protein